MLATVNRNQGSPVLKLYELRSSRLEFRFLTQVSLSSVDKCVHFLQHQDVFLLTYESGQAEYVRFQIRIGGGSEQVTRFNVWKLQTVQHLMAFDRTSRTRLEDAGGAQDSATPG